MAPKLNIYLICEGTSCEFLEKYAKVSGSKKSSISDYGLIESYYFNRNSDNTEYFNDENSIYLTSTKGSTIDSSLIIYGGGEGRRVFPIPYTTNGKYIHSISDLRSLMDEFGLNKSVNKYMKQEKFDTFSSYLPSYNVELNWTFQSKNLSDYTQMNINKFLTFVHKLSQKSENLENIFLVCDAPFIIAMMNITHQNRYSYNDRIEHTSFWKFEFEVKKEGLWATNVPKIISRHKLYPLGRNHGLLQEYDDLFFYIYKDLRVPLFYYNKSDNKPIPKIYLQSKYLTLCKGIRALPKVKSEEDKGKKVERRSNNTFKKTLQKIRLNQFMK